MGFLLSKIGWSSDPPGYDDPNEKTGLTPRQVDLVRNSWATVKKNVRGNGVELFLRFFKMFPENQKYFKTFADVPFDQLKNNGRLLGHATSVVYSLTSLVDNLDDLECLIELLVKIADSHVPRKINGQHFNQLTEAIIPFLCDKLGPEVMTEDAKEAWLKVMGIVNSTIQSEMEKKGVITPSVDQPMS